VTLHSTLTELRLDNAVVALSDRDFTVCCYRAVLKRDPEFDNALDLSSLTARVDYILDIVGSDELRFVPDLDYQEVALRFSRALGREEAAAAIFRQLQSSFPSLSAFLDAVSSLAEGIVGRSRNALTALDSYPISHLSFLYEQIQAEADQGGARDERLSVLRRDVDLLAARLAMLERKVF
jgi:hypothetical protein